MEFFEQLYGVPWRHPYVWQGESCGFREAPGSITKEKFITHTLALLGDLSKNFSRYDMQRSCWCGASLVNPKLIEKLQHVRDILGKSMSGVCCESFNASIKGSLVSSHMPDSDRIGLAVYIACTNSIDRYELVEVVQKFFKRIGIVGDSGNFIQLAMDKTKPQEVLWPY